MEDPPSNSVKFIARRVLTAYDSKNSNRLATMSSPDRSLSPPTGLETYTSLDNFHGTPTNHSAQLSPGRVQQPQGQPDPELPDLRAGIASAVSHKKPPQGDPGSKYQKAHKTRAAPSKIARKVNKRAKHTKGDLPGAVKRNEERRVLELPRHEPPEPPQKARPPAPPDEMPRASVGPSERSAAVSEASVSTSRSAMEMDNDLHQGEVEVLLQPQTRPITLEQLVVEVRTIYEGVVQFEDKAIRVDEEHTQSAQLDPKTRKSMSKDDYMSYIALHKALLHEHHDLCLASQHPAASPSLRQLPARYSIPARMWRHGVHAPLEILRMRLPESREHMIAFILISFNHMTLFLETVPQFEATWLECIGDLGRYRLALAEKDDERETFSGIARDWYYRAIALNPQISRLYHHCAILAPSFSLEQLSLYGRALTGLIPFLPTRKSITALFRPVLSNNEDLIGQIPEALLTVLRAHAFLALGGSGSRQGFNQCLVELHSGLFEKLFRDASEQQQDVKKLGVHLAVACSSAMLQYGATRPNGTSASILRLALDVGSQATTEFEGLMGGFHGATGSAKTLDILTSHELNTSRTTVKAASTLAFGMFAEALHRPKDEDLYPFLHIFFVMIWCFTGTSKAIQEVENEIPWKDIATFLNTYANAATMTVDILSFDFPVNAGGRQQPLPEDHVLRGLIFSKGYLPVGWTEASNLDLAEQEMEKRFMTAARLQRLLWAGHKIAQHQKWIFYDDFSRRFSAAFGMQGVQSQADDADFIRLLPEGAQKH